MSSIFIEYMCRVFLLNTCVEYFYEVRTFIEYMCRVFLLIEYMCRVFLLSTCVEYFIEYMGSNSKFLE